jgi:hypothetical protein
MWVRSKYWHTKGGCECLFLVVSPIFRTKLYPQESIFCFIPLPQSQNNHVIILFN